MIRLRLEINLPSIKTGRETLASCINGLLAAAFTCIAFWYGLANGLHHVIPDAIEYHNRALAAAITDLGYDANLGGGASAKVLDTLQRNGITVFEDKLRSLGLKWPENIFNPEIVDGAIEKAFGIEGLSLESQHINSDIVLSPPFDIGHYVFYKAALWLFGHHVSSFYYLYFLLFAASVVFFSVAYFRNPHAMLLLAALCATHLLLVATIVPIGKIQGIYHLATVHNNRFISALGVLPALHLALALWIRASFSRRHFLSAIGQAAILLFIVMTRMSILWGVLLVAVIVAPRFWRLAASALEQRISDADVGRHLRTAFSWPLLVVFAGLLILGIWRSTSIHPLYQVSDEYVPHHVTWHTAYLGLGLHPQWWKDFAPLHMRDGKLPGSDGIPVVAVENYMENYGFDRNYFISPISGIKWRTYERVLGRVYLEFAVHHPRFMLELHTWYKPRHFGSIYIQIMRPTLASISPLALLAGVAAMIGAACLSIDARQTWRRENGSLVAFTGIVFLASMTPLIFAAPSGYASGDQIWMLNAFIVFGAATYAARPAAKLAERLMKRVASAPAKARTIEKTPDY